MDVSDYLPMFIAECREHLQELNLAVVRIEEQPDDRETVDEIFRIAHSLKGMSATMGFAAIAHLTHEMEEVFELFRERAGGLSREAIDILLECLDALGVAIEAIDTDGAEKLDPEPLVVKLRALVREPAAEPEPDLSPDPSEVAAAGSRVVHVKCRLIDETLMPAVRGFQVLATLAEHGELVRSNPSDTAVEAFAGREIEAWLTTAAEEATIVASVRAVAEVASASAKALEPEAAAETHPSPGAATTSDGGHKKASSNTVRVDAERLDQLMHLMGELVVQRTGLESLLEGVDVPGVAQAMQGLIRSSQALQAHVMQVRMIPVEVVFMRFPRLVRDLSTKLDKQVELVLSGKETELDRTVVDSLGDPIVHLVRNSLDHGLEPPDVREAAGKPAQGTLEISARHQGGNVVIEVRDDGRGIDAAHVARKAVERGLITAEQAESVDTAKAVELLFAPGFSTAEETSDISGRGVGMDAVRSAVRGLGGEVTLLSVPGQGTTAQIRLPLTLAIMAALLVDSGSLPFAIPLDRVERTLELRSQTVRSVAGTPMLVLDDAALPLIELAEAVGNATTGTSTHVVIIHASDRRIALGVDALIGQRELVTRPLPSELGNTVALSGGAVLANGEIALIVNCDAIGTGDTPGRRLMLAA